MRGLALLGLVVCALALGACASHAPVVTEAMATNPLAPECGGR